MRAFQVIDHAKPAQLAALDLPKPGPGQIRLKIAACGLNFADLLMLGGSYQDTPALPFTLGLEVAGTVDAIGPDVALETGMRVAVFAGQGGLADYGVFDAARAVAIPDVMPFSEAAGFLVAYGTSHLALTRRARLKSGERLVVLGAAGGVGLTAVEIGAQLGAEVVAVARGPEKLKIAAGAGATHLIDSTSADLRAELKALGGVDVVYDAVGGDQAAACLRAMRPEGRFIIIGFASGDPPKLAANHMLVKNIEAIGFYWGGYMAFAPERITQSLSELFTWYEAGRVSPHIGAQFPLSQAAEALEFLQSRKSTGKVVVTMDA
ncbi:MAG: NADPH:quinone oxidoreductase family protein [Pseudomonadota bacterium]